ncbi:PHP domain-containing protein [Aquipuribacter nitratireducens]|uniref:PHP domain-containing protein n=1 Tax=Aquipuribacter nitratireducens TaxID=650104 RepID=A0ABW0GQV0_9MICO
MPYDLHTHSAVSDGTTSPAEVVAAAAAAGVTGLALTDHDTGAGLAEAAAAAKVHGVDLVPGIEVSTSHRGRSVHLLAYGDVAGDPHLAGVLAGTVDSRRHRLRRIVDGVRRAVPALTVEAVLDRVPAGVTPGRPHVADALVALGAVPTRDEAFRELLAEDGPYYVPYRAPDLERTVADVVAAGGVAVLAHPGSRSAADVVDEATLERLTAVGLAGLEVDHRDHDPATRARLRSLAGALGLLVTGASDYHGEGKQNRIAEHTTPDDVVHALLARVRATD